MAVAKKVPPVQQAIAKALSPAMNPTRAPQAQSLSSNPGMPQAQIARAPLATAPTAPSAMMGQLSQIGQTRQMAPQQQMIGSAPGLPQQQQAQLPGLNPGMMAQQGIAPGQAQNFKAQDPGARMMPNQQLQQMQNQMGMANQATQMGPGRPGMASTQPMAPSQMNPAAMQQINQMKQGLPQKQQSLPQLDPRMQAQNQQSNPNYAAAQQMMQNAQAQSFNAQNPNSRVLPNQAAQAAERRKMLEAKEMQDARAALLSRKASF